MLCELKIHKNLTKTCIQKRKNISLFRDFDQGLNSGQNFFVKLLFLLIMKKLLFGMAFLVAMAFSGVSLQAQEEEPGLDGGGSGSTVCCKDIGKFCEDRFGNAYSDSIESPGPTCTKP